MWYSLLVLVVLRLFLHPHLRRSLAVNALILAALLAYPVFQLIALSPERYLRSTGGWLQVAGILLLLLALIRACRRGAPVNRSPSRT